MKTKVQFTFILILSSLLWICSCEKDDTTESPKTSNQTPTDTTDYSDTVVDRGPQDGDYDFYISMCYSDPQPANENMKHFYILVACEDSTQTMETVEMKIQGVGIPLEYANYGGPDFYIAYYDMEIADTFHCELTMNGETTSADLAIPSELNMELPSILDANKDIALSWEMEKDPDVIYIEGFQRNQNQELLRKEVKHFVSSSRDFTMPSAWLWSEENTDIREIVAGTINYTIKNRVCFTMSDNAYKVYQ